MSANIKDNKALQAVINTLKFHQTNTESRKLVRFIEKEHPSLVNDAIQLFRELFNGTLDENNKTLESIHNLLLQALAPIDIKTSAPLKRFYDQNNYKQFKDSPSQLYSNVLDSLYVYFIHSYDLGFKVKGKAYKKDEDQKADNDMDDQIAKLKAYLSNKQSQLQDVIPNYLNANKDNDDLKQNYDHFEYYSYGSAYNYWLRGDDQMYTNKKYENLKDELTSNKIHPLDMERVKYVMHKARVLQKVAEFKKIKANKSHGDDWHIVGNSPLELGHIVTLLICADIPKAHRAFHGVICGDAEEKESRELNHEIYQFSRLIREAVECYGTPLTQCKYDMFYYGINTLDSLLFSDYIAKFNAPILITPSLESALISTDNGNGYILELVEHDSRLTYFDLRGFSDRTINEQMLFCGGALPLRIVNIRQVALNKNYKRIVSALSVLDTIIGGQRPNERPNASDFELIQKILKKDTNGFPEYIKNLFEYYVICVKRVNINFYFFNDYFKQLSGILAATDKECMVLIGNVMQFFPCCEYIGIEGGPAGIEANEAYLSALLENVSKLEKGSHELKRIELKNAKFEMPVVFDKFMESFFNAGFDVNMEKKLYDKSLVFKVVDED
eukprot:186745_1